MGGRAPKIAPASTAAQEQRVKELEAEVAQQNARMESDRAAASAAEAERQRRQMGRVATIRTSPQGVLTPNANEAPQLKAVLG